MHGGRPASVCFVPRKGPVRFASRGHAVGLHSLTVAHTRRSTAVNGPCGVVSTVEHAFAALAGAGVWRDVCVEVDGDELPLLDGTAAPYFDAIDALAITPCPPPMVIVSEAVIEVEASRYEFSPGQDVHVEVSLEWHDDRLAPSASWRGSKTDFRERIATARTFAFERDLSFLGATGLARHVDPASVVLIARDIHFAGRPFTSDEPARHKLLDLIGDAYLHGGPPIGTVRAYRPGHTANHAAFARAKELGVLAARRV